MDKNYNFEDFINIMKKLIADDGCPWDRIQTHESLRRYLIEESYEVIEAINNNNSENLCEELGDVLLQVVFHSLIAEKNSEFLLDDVINEVSKKMIRRHPHIFADSSAKDAEEVLVNWDEIKKKEKNYTRTEDILKAVPKALPALMRAEKVQDKAYKAGFGLDGILACINEIERNIDSIKSKIDSNCDEIFEDYGNLLFCAANISRFLKINPEFALTNATEKFINRFGHIEDNSPN